MVLETNNYSTVARAAGVDPRTLKSWVKEYEMEVRDQMEKEGMSLISLEPTEMDYKRKYEMAMKLLGEKELEITILKDALKKTNVPG